MEKVDEKPIINLIFLYLFNLEKQFEFYKLSFENDIHKIESQNAIYEISENAFEYGELKANISIEFYNSSKENIKTINFPVFHCENNIYIQMDSDGNGINFCCIFNNIKELNIFANGNLINIKINENVLYLNKNSNQTDFIQYSIDLSDFKVISKKIEVLNQPDLHLLMKKKQTIDNFYKELTELFSYKLNYQNQYYQILNYYKTKIDLFNFNLHLSKQKLKEYFGIYKIELETIFKYSNFYLFHEGQKKYAKDITLFKKIYDKLEDFYKKIKIEESLEIYEKIILLCRITRILFFLMILIL